MPRVKSVINDTPLGFGVSDFESFGSNWDETVEDAEDAEGPYENSFQIETSNEKHDVKPDLADEFLAKMNAGIEERRNNDNNFPIKSVFAKEDFSQDSWVRMMDHELLTKEEELDLLRRVADGRCVISYPDKGDNGRKDVFLTSDDAEKHAKFLATFYVKLVASIARKHLGRGIGLKDLILEGILGLQRAIIKYDINKLTDKREPHRLSTYATPWIRQNIVRVIANESRNIRIANIFIIRSDNCYAALSSLRVCSAKSYIRLASSKICNFS